MKTRKRKVQTRTAVRTAGRPKPPPPDEWDAADEWDEWDAADESDAPDAPDAPAVKIGDTIELFFCNRRAECECLNCYPETVLVHGHHGDTVIGPKRWMRCRNCHHKVTQKCLAEKIGEAGPSAAGEEA